MQHTKGFLSHARRFFTPTHLLCRSQIYLPIEYWLRLWGGQLPKSLALLVRVQRKTIRLVGDPSLTSKLLSLAHRRKVDLLSLSYRYFGFCSLKFASSVLISMTFDHLSHSQTSSHAYQVSVQKFRISLLVLFFLKILKLWNLPFICFFYPITFYFYL